MFFSITASSILRGEGNMKAPMIGMVVGTILNIILDPLLIFGLMGFPRLGIDGAAIATVISRFVTSLITVWFLFRPNTLIKIELKNFKFEKLFIKEILWVGIPSSLSHCIMSIAMMILTRILSIFGPLAIAAYGIGFRIESIIILPVYGIATSVITIVGQNVGAGNLRKAEDTAWKASYLSMAVVLPIIILFVIFPTEIFSIFTRDSLVIEYGKNFLMIMSVSYIFAALGLNLGSAFQGAGQAMPSLALTSIRLLIIGVPLAIVLAFTFEPGLNGVWLGFSTSTVVTTIIGIIWFRAGIWKNR